MTLPRYLFACDPGLLTGAALFSCEDGKTVEKLWSDELEFHQTSRTLEELLKDLGPELNVVYENFIISERTARLTEAPWSLQLIGAARYLTMKYNGVEPVLQVPAQRNFASNERLHSIGMWHVGGEGHARDAIRHGVVYLVNKGWRPEGLLL